MKKLVIVLTLAVMGCTHSTLSEEQKRKNLHQFIDQWHADAAATDTAYFEKIADKGIFIGTDKTEHWSREEFMAFAKPYFDKGQAWDFTATERNLYLHENGDIAWFDELLDTWMGTCRASGVLSRHNNSWKIEHYHLSVAVPNDTIEKVIELIKEYEKSK